MIQDLTQDTQKVTYETIRAYKLVNVHTTWLDGRTEQKVMELHDALAHQLVYVTQSKIIAIWAV